jgi:hypothetical protein
MAPCAAISGREASSKAQQHHGQGITFPIMLLGRADEVIE